MTPCHCPLLSLPSAELCRISQISQFLTPEAAKTPVHPLVLSCLDYCNAALVGLPDTEISKIQCVLKAAARLTSCCGKYKHITPVVRELY